MKELCTICDTIYFSEIGKCPTCAGKQSPIKKAKPAPTVAKVKARAAAMGDDD